MYQPVNYPDIFIYNEENPTLVSPTSPFELSFAQTKDSLMDVETYKEFLTNSIQRFRKCKTYKHYKASLMQLGLNRCQFHANINSGTEDQEMATIEMHHHILTIFDIALIITEHVLNTYSGITTFDLVEMLKLEHTEHRVCTVCLCKTCHQLQHNDPNFFLPSTMGFGKWWEFLERYRTGITRDIAMKLIYGIEREIKYGESKELNTLQLLSIRDTILNWSDYNERFFL